jgi:ClpP class serine protease
MRAVPKAKPITSRTQSVHLSDLSPEDKVPLGSNLSFFIGQQAKVAKLVDQIIDLGRENDCLKKKITTLERRENENLSKIEAGLSESIFELTEKIQQLERNRTDSLHLLSLYQHKLSQVGSKNSILFFIER